MKENLIVLFGGKSVEHDISIITALQIMKNIPKKYNVVPVYIKRDGKWCVADNLTEVDTFIDFDTKVIKEREIVLGNGEPFLYVKKRNTCKKYLKVDCALMCLHGGEGEDGGVVAVLSSCDIPFTSSGHTSSAICMDKIFTKQVLSSCKIDNVDFCYFTKQDYVQKEKDVLKKIKQFGYPVIVKPANLGSSVAIGIAYSEKDIKEKFEIALEFDERVLVEKYLKECEEYNCACVNIDDKVVTSKVVHVDKGQFFSFEEKYIKECVKNTKKIEKNIEKQIKDISKSVYKVLNCAGVVRIDFLVTSEKVYVNEINSIPGSLSIHMFSGISRREFIENLIVKAKEKQMEKKELSYVFQSDALKIFKSAINLAKSNK